jgi:hypothetical protein
MKLDSMEARNIIKILFKESKFNDGVSSHVKGKIKVEIFESSQRHISLADLDRYID